MNIDTILPLVKSARNEFCPLSRIEAVLSASNLEGIKHRPTPQTSRISDPVRSNFSEIGFFAAVTRFYRQAEISGDTFSQLAHSPDRRTLRKSRHSDHRVCE